MLAIKKILFSHPFSRIFVFVLIGGVAYIIYAASFYSALHVFGWDMFVAVMFAYAMTIVFHFPANRYITFHDRHTGVLWEFVRYALVYMFSAAVAYWLSKWFFGLRLPRAWGYLLPFVSTAVSYFLSCMFIWKHQWGRRL